MLIVRYIATGQALNDASVQDFVDNLISLNNETGQASADVGNFLVIDCLRVAIAEGKIAYSDAVAKINDSTVEFDEYANMINWPKGFQDPTVKYLREIISARTAKYKTERIL
ncbi:hypothetical protein RsoM2USA_40 [Ralstonia phage RsoM2USA]|nr:hypothetical protein RsoM2USA_40 [Ralstonia phage RsoM2USA]